MILPATLTAADVPQSSCGTLPLQHPLTSQQDLTGAHLLKDEAQAQAEVMLAGREHVQLAQQLILVAMCLLWDAMTAAAAFCWALRRQIASSSTILNYAQNMHPG